MASSVNFITWEDVDLRFQMENKNGRPLSQPEIFTKPPDFILGEGQGEGKP